MWRRTKRAYHTYLVQVMLRLLRTDVDPLRGMQVFQKGCEGLAKRSIPILTGIGRRSGLISSASLDDTCDTPSPVPSSWRRNVGADGAGSVVYLYEHKYWAVFMLSLSPTT